jgi:hypothetical protein
MDYSEKTSSRKRRQLKQPPARKELPEGPVHLISWTLPSSSGDRGAKSYVPDRKLSWKDELIENELALCRAERAAKANGNGSSEPGRILSLSHLYHFVVAL